MRQNKLKLLPKGPGVYIFKDKAGRSIYIGKAASLSKRVLSYFRKPAPSPKIASIIDKLYSVEYIVTSSELEALILESNLIKKHHPRYNVILRDDKQYPYLKLTVNEEWPRLLFVRRMENDGAKYFGPYRSQMIKETLRLIKRLFPIRWCKETPMKIRKQPCMYFYIKKCVGPCIGATSHESYMNLVFEIENLLEGRLDKIVKSLKVDMREASDRLEFEKARALRDRAKILERMAEGQKVVSTEVSDADVSALFRIGGKACFMVFKIREGKLIDRDFSYPTGGEGIKDEELFTSAVLQYYRDAASFPGEIIIQYEPENPKLFEQFLNSKGKTKINIETPKRGSKLKLVNMAYENAKLLLERKILEETESAKVLADLKEAVNLKTIPIRIEAFDISNISGYDIVGSMVAFLSALPYKKDYRRFAVRTVRKPDDVSSIYEIVKRRYRGSLREELPLPDLILIDGGTPQVRAGKRALVESRVNVPIIAIAKRLENIYVPEKITPIMIPKGSKALKLLQRIRDEAHRFAIAYHREKRRKRSLKG